jgi:hypothetical protein
VRGHFNVIGSSEDLARKALPAIDCDDLPTLMQCFKTNHAVVGE